MDVDSARVKDLADALGTKPPTVVRTIARLRELGLVEQPRRGEISLTGAGSELSAQLVHRHADVQTLLQDVLGVPALKAEGEACLIEHGLSGETAQRLHEFLLRWRKLPDTTRRQLKGRRASTKIKHFNLIGGALGSGRRQ